MTASEFKTRWERELGKYLQERDPSHANGKYRGACHQYIIDCDEQDKLSLIVQDNILDDVLGMRQDFKDLIGKPHKAAHFLNSSQIVCYNFFRRMMGNGVYNDTKLRCYGHPTAEMLSFVKQKIGAEISSSAKCVFEYEDKNIREEFRRLVENGKGEKSNYDFYIEDGDIRIFFEIKYTETSFGNWSRSQKTDEQIKNHCTYCKDGYVPRIQKNIFFTPEGKRMVADLKRDEFAKSDLFFNKQYQLYRNAMRADSTSYSVFIFPEANPNPQEEFDSFSNNLVPGQNHIIALKWEDLQEFMSDEFKKKYINFLLK